MRRKIGLALGGGGMRGYAHIGVLKVLEKNNIPIDFISGTSIGSIIGALYAYYKSVEKLEEIALSADWHKLLSFIDPSILKGGLIEGERIREFIEKNIKHSRFEDLKIPLTIIATDINTAKMIEIKEGDVSSAVRASISIPLVIKPVELDGKFLVDGGLSSPVPTASVRRMGADVIIAVNLDNDSYFRKDSKVGSLIASRSIQILQYHLAKKDLRYADIIIEPEVGDVGIISVEHILENKRKEVMMKGEIAAQNSLDQIKKAINKPIKKSCFFERFLGFDNKR